MKKETEKVKTIVGRDLLNAGYDPALVEKLDSAFFRLYCSPNREELKALEILKEYIDDRIPTVDY